ncbi:MAG: PH domain-containing protein [Planctomyces sp.]|nr:PH domain-containing protein [Planctomyces sp.]
MSTVPLQQYRASFNPLIRPYLVLNIGFVMICTLIGIPLAIVWFCGVGQWWARHYFDKLECELTSTRLRFRKGIIFEVEKTIPLDNVQDVTFVEGPLLRHFHLSILKFETAGQSAGQANSMQLVGVIDAHNLRNEILSRRELLKKEQAAPAAATSQSNTTESVVVLKEILIRLDDIVAHLNKK